MKKKILLTSVILFNLTLFISCSSIESNEDEILENKKVEQNQFESREDDDDGGGSGSVTTTWTIGRKSQDCFSLGICKLKKIKVKYLGVEATIYGNRMFSGEVKKIDVNNFVLQVDEENMRDIVKEFGGKYLILEEDFIIEKIDSEELGLSDNFTIESGTYGFIKNEINSLYELQITN